MWFKKIIYVLFVTILVIIGFPFMMFCRDKWNAFGRKIDYFFGIKSPHTVKWEKENNK